MPHRFVKTARARRNLLVIVSYCAVTTVALVASSAIGIPVQLLMLLIAPILLAALLRERYVYLSMFAFFSASAFVITDNYRQPITDSTITVFAILLTTLVACEAIRFTARREARLSRIAAENEQRLRTFIDNAADAIFVVDARDQIVETNEAAVKMFGYDRELLLQSDFKKLFDVPDADSLESQNEFRHASGTLIDVEMSTGRFETRGRTTRIFIVRDTRDRNRAEAQLRQAEAIRESILESTSDYIMMLDGEYRVQFINRVLPDLNVETVTGTNILDYVEPDEIVSMTACYERVRKTRMPSSFETRYISNEDGSVTYFESRVAPIIEDDAVAGFIISSSDVTERKKREAERLAFERNLLQSQKLESLGLLAGGVAHDFNNLLVSIMGRADLARDETDNPARIGEHLQQILEASQHAASLCQQLLAYSGKGRFVIAPTNLAEFLEATRKLLEISIPDNVRIAYELDPAPHTIQVDTTQLRQVIMNLVTNAYEALQPEGGHVVIRTGLKQLNAADRLRYANGEHIKDGSYACLEVEDDGAGMTAETTERLFDPFYTTKPDGTGLGMAAVLGIVRGHSGAMSVTSKQQRGTTIRVVLPAALVGEEKTGNVAEPSHPITENTGTILVVDDEPAVRTVATAILKRAKFDVIAVESGREAIDIVIETGDRIDAVVLDMKMPDMNGVQVMEKLRGIRPDLPILLSSGYSETEVSERTECEGVSAFLPKPYLARELIAAVNGVLTPIH